MLQFLSERHLGVLAVLIFIACLLLLEAVYFLWKANRGSEARKLSRRMQALATHSRTAQVQVVKGSAASAAPGLERWLAGLPRMRRLERYIGQADTRFTVLQLGLASLVAALLGFTFATRLLHQRPLTGLVVGVLLTSVPWLLIALKRGRRLARIQRQLPDALDFIGRALRSGQAFNSALLMAGEELPEPIAAEFRAAHDEITFGVSLENALAHMSERLPITDLRYFVVSVLIQRDSGGNLTEVLDNLSRLIRERYKLMSKIKVLSADGRFSGWILVLAPFVLGGLMNVFKPKFMAVLWTDPMGVSIVKTLLVLMLVGIVIMRRIVTIRV